MPTSYSSFENRLAKNLRRLMPWAQRQGLTAFRLYDRDIPEYPYAIDWYAGRVHLLEYPSRREIREGKIEAQRPEVDQAIQRVLGLAPDRIFRKPHRPMAWGKEQYGRLSRSGERFVVEENGLKFWVDLESHLDTGLFLDHRNTRALVRSASNGKRMLNLFGYTGSFTVYAAAGGAQGTTTVDLSAKYLRWAQDNLALNGLAGRAHRTIEADASAWLAEEDTRYDLIVLDPPSYSTSKKMAGTFDVQKHHPRLVRTALERLTNGGTLYFSTNFQQLIPAFDLPPGVEIAELTPRSIPIDFPRQDAHRCWRIQAR